MTDDVMDLTITALPIVDIDDEFEKYTKWIDDVARWYKVNAKVEARLDNLKQDIETKNGVVLQRLAKEGLHIRHPGTVKEAYDYNEQRWLQSMDALIAKDNPHIMRMWADEDGN